MSLSTAVLAAAEEHHESVNHWLVGGIALVILMALLLGLIAFGGGRDHS